MGKKEGKIISIQEKTIQRMINKRRPPEELRDQLDLGYRLENSELEIFQIRPSLRNDNDKKKIESPIAKVTYIKSKKHWKLYWRRASGKWEAYKPYKVANTLEELLTVIHEDEYYCFWG